MEARVSKREKSWHCCLSSIAVGYDTLDAQIMVRALESLDIVGADLVEVAPDLDPSGLTTLTGVTMMWELLCVLANAVARRRAHSV